jgi:sterol 14-demethylase
MPLLGNAVEFFRNPVAVFRRGYESLGPIFSIRLGPKPAAVLLGPEYNRFFFTETDNVLSMREVYKFVVPMFGEVTFAAEPAEYREQRAILLPAFHAKKAPAQVAGMVGETLARLDALGPEGEFELWSFLEQLSMHIAAGALLGAEFRRRFGERFWALYRDVAGGMEFVLPPNLPLPRFRRRDRARRELLELLRPLIEERRARPEGHDDFLQELSTATYSDGRPVSAETITGMILMLVFAAYDTTAAQTSWALVQLLQHSHYRFLVLEEQRRVLRDDPANINDATLRSLERLEWALKESERLRPITTMLWRYTAKPYDLGGYHVPRGWLTMVCPYVSHRLPGVFSNPDAYDPARFAPWRAEERRKPFSLVNFGGGAHRCLGVHFAYNEMKVILSLLLQRFDMELAEPDPRPTFDQGIARPKAPTMIKYRRRAPLVPQAGLARPPFVAAAGLS